MTIREAALRHARAFLGVTEHPPGSNRGPQIDEWNRDACGILGVYWCLSFIHGMYLLAGTTLPGGASVANLLASARARQWVVKRPRRGDIACLEFGGDGLFDDHAAIVERTLALRWTDGRFTGWIQTIEGNTSSGDAGSQDNGGGVFRRRRWLRGISATFVRVPGDAR